MNYDLKPLYSLLVTLRTHRSGYTMAIRPEGSGKLFYKKNASCIQCPQDLVDEWIDINDGINKLNQELKKYTN